MKEQIEILFDVLDKEGQGQIEKDDLIQLGKQLGYFDLERNLDYL